MINNFWIVWFIASLATATMTLTISRGKIFSFLRNWLKKHAHFLSELIECPYCLAHWVALFMATAIHMRAFSFMSTGIFNILLSAFALVPPASVIMAIMYKSISIIKKEEEGE